MATYADKLASVEAAIAKIEGGAQRVDFANGAGSTTYADLPSLYAERRRLEPLAAREARGGGPRIGYGTPT